MMDVSAWLCSLGLEQYVAAFGDNAVDGEVLRDLSDADLQGLGIAPLGHRKKLLKAIAALAAKPASAAAEASPSQPAAGEGERRQVTVLFADIAGYTELSRRLGPEDTHALLDSFFLFTDAVIGSYGGSVDKHIGDCVMAVFGAPKAYGNDAERAVQAALAIHDGMPRLNADTGH